MGNQSFADIERDIVLENGTALDILNALNLIGRWAVTSEQLVKFLDGAAIDREEIKRIRVCDCILITDEAITYLAVHFTKVTHLSISGCERVTGFAIQAITNSCSQLESLYAGGCDIRHLPEDLGVKLPVLKRLALWNNKIKRIPPSIGLLRLQLFHIYGNPVQKSFVDKLAAEQGSSAVLKDYEELGVALLPPYDRNQIENQPYNHTNMLSIKTGDRPSFPQERPNPLTSSSAEDRNASSYMTSTIGRGTVRSKSLARGCICLDADYFEIIDECDGQYEVVKIS